MIFGLNIKNVDHIYLLLVPCDLGNLGYTCFTACSNVESCNIYAPVFGNALIVGFTSICALVALHTLGSTFLQYTICHLILLLFDKLLIPFSEKIYSASHPRK